MIGYFLLGLGFLTYLAAGATICQYIDDKVKEEQYDKEWHSSTADKVIKLLLWPFFAGVYFGITWLLEDWLGGDND